MKNQKGITLVALLITIIIMAILASVATYSGLESVKSAQISTFTEELEMIQARVNVIYEKRKKSAEEKAYYDNLGQDVTIVNQELLTAILGDSSSEGFRYFSKEDLTKLELDDIRQDVIINFNTGEVISVTGIKIDDVMYYKLKDLPNYSMHDVEYVNKMTDAKDFIIEQTKLSDSYRITIKDVNGNDINSGTLSYKLQENENWLLNGTNMSFIISEFGIYDVKYTDTAGNSKINQFAMRSVDDKSGANEPKVSKIAKKTYVTWKLNEDGTEYIINDKHITPPSDWYDYGNGKWANIKTTNNGLEAYWVWIPRYEYIVPTSTSKTEIEVKFIPVSKKEPDEGYIIHPAFTNEGNGGFGELDGIWVAKFEASSNTETPDTNYGGGNDLSLKVQVRPEVQSWRAIATDNMFKVCRKMTNTGEVLEGSTVDSHMMKNTEWGAVAILSQSKYGVYNPESLNGEKGNKEYQVWNAISDSMTGRVGTDKDDGLNTSGFAYNSATGPKASTTGTVYGVYDMAGGSYERVAGVLKGNSEYLEYANSEIDISNQVKPEEMNVLEFAKKYLDFYNYRTSHTDYSQYIIGDATVETKGWNSDWANFVRQTSPVFVRGSRGGSVLSGIFSFENSSRIESNFDTFRVVVVP